MGFLYSQLFFRPTYPTTSYKGKTIIVTGGNVGLGKEAMRHLARLGADKIIMGVRNLESGEAAKRDILSTTGREEDTIEVWKLDLMSFASVQAFADRASKLPRLDALLANASIATSPTPPMEMAEGHEKTITTNVISTFLLVLLMLPLLKATAKKFDTQPHISIVVSVVHSHTTFSERQYIPKLFPALSDPATAVREDRYDVSKLLQVLVVRTLARRLAGSGVVLNMTCPGLCHSELARESSWQLQLTKFFLARSTEVGSRTLMAALAAPPSSHGSYLSDGEVHDERLSPFVRSQEGVEAGEKTWEELGAILEGVRPGVLAAL